MRQLTRDQAIADIRNELMKLVDDEHSMCDVAARQRIFCEGFAQWTFGELRRHYPQIVRSRPRVTPAEMRDLANRWQLARQEVKGTRLSCDTQMGEGAHRTCGGWNEFSREQLASFHASLCHEEVEVIDAPKTPRP